MWIAEKGTCHTVALRDPTELMSDSFRRSLYQLLERSQEEEMNVDPRTTIMPAIGYGVRKRQLR